MGKAYQRLRKVKITRTKRSNNSNGKRRVARRKKK